MSDTLFVIGFLVGGITGYLTRLIVFNEEHKLRVKVNSKLIENVECKRHKWTEWGLKD